VTKRDIYVKRLGPFAESGPDHEAAMRRIATALKALEQEVAREPSRRDWLGPKEVAKTVGLSEKTIRRAIDHGELRASKVRSRLRIKAADVETWLRENPVSIRRGTDWEL
jgi:excisionase family DNA binding protein